MDPKTMTKVKALLQQAMDMIDAEGSSKDAEDAADGGADDSEEDDNGLPNSLMAMKLAKYK